MFTNTIVQSKSNAIDLDIFFQPWLTARYLISSQMVSNRCMSSSSSAIDLVRRTKASVFYLTDIMQKTSRAHTHARDLLGAHTYWHRQQIDLLGVDYWTNYLLANRERYLSTWTSLMFIFPSFRVLNHHQHRVDERACVLTSSYTRN